MDKNTFTLQVQDLASYQNNAFKLEDILGESVSTESFIGRLIDSYGELILTTATGGKELPDEIFERFWNLVITNPEELLEQDIYELYEEIMRV